jgi:hypothetical protein
MIRNLLRADRVPDCARVRLLVGVVTGLSPDQGKSTVCVASGESKPRDHVEPGQT